MPCLKMAVRSFGREVVFLGSLAFWDREPKDFLGKQR